jgi:hypothetical protein
MTSGLSPLEIRFDSSVLVNFSYIRSKTIGQL